MKTQHRLLCLHIVILVSFMNVFCSASKIKVTLRSRVKNLQSPVIGSDSYTYSDSPYESEEGKKGESERKTQKSPSEKSYSNIDSNILHPHMLKNDSDLNLKKINYMVDPKSKNSFTLASNKFPISNKRLDPNSNSNTNTNLNQNSQEGIQTNVVIRDDFENVEKFNKEDLLKELAELEKQAYRMLLFTETPKNKGNLIDKSDPIPYYDKLNLKEKGLEQIKDQIISIRKKLGMKEDINFYVLIDGEEERKKEEKNENLDKPKVFMNQAKQHFMNDLVKGKMLEDLLKTNKNLLVPSNKGSFETKTLLMREGLAESNNIVKHPIDHYSRRFNKVISRDKSQYNFIKVWDKNDPQYPSQNMTGEYGGKKSLNNKYSDDNPIEDLI